MFCSLCKRSWNYETGLGSIRWRERTARLTHPGEAANSVRSTTREGASDIHLPLLYSNGSLKKVPNSPVLKVDMGTGTWIYIWSDAARNHPLPGENNGRACRHLGHRIRGDKRIVVDNFGLERFQTPPMSAFDGEHDPGFARFHHLAEQRCTGTSFTFFTR